MVVSNYYETKEQGAGSTSKGKKSGTRTDGHKSYVPWQKKIKVSLYVCLCSTVYVRVCMPSVLSSIYVYV